MRDVLSEMYESTATGMVDVYCLPCHPDLCMEVRNHIYRTGMRELRGYIQSLREVAVVEIGGISSTAWFNRKWEEEFPSP